MVRAPTTSAAPNHSSGSVLFHAPIETAPQSCIETATWRESGPSRQEFESTRSMVTSGSLWENENISFRELAQAEDSPTLNQVGSNITDAARDFEARLIPPGTSAPFMSSGRGHRRYPDSTTSPCPSGPAQLLAPQRGGEGFTPLSGTISSGLQSASAQALLPEVQLPEAILIPVPLSLFQRCPWLRQMSQQMHQG